MTGSIVRVPRAVVIAADEIGIFLVSQDAAEGLSPLVDATYEKRSVANSSNLHPANAFDEFMPKSLATVDRLVRPAHVCQTTGESVRKAQAPRGPG